MFERDRSLQDIFDRLRQADPRSRHHVTDMVRDEATALAKTARAHPAASGSALALVGAVAFGLGFLAANIKRKPVEQPQRVFRSRKARWDSKTARKRRRPFHSQARHDGI